MDDSTSNIHLKNKKSKVRHVCGFCQPKFLKHSEWQTLKSLYTIVINMTCSSTTAVDKSFLLFHNCKHVTKSSQPKLSLQHRALADPTYTCWRDIPPPQWDGRLTALSFPVFSDLFKQMWHKRESSFQVRSRMQSAGWDSLLSPPPLLLHVLTPLSCCAHPCEFSLENQTSRKGIFRCPYIFQMPRLRLWDWSLPTSHSCKSNRTTFSASLTEDVWPFTCFH